MEKVKIVKKKFCKVEGGNCTHPDPNNTQFKMMALWLKKKCWHSFFTQLYAKLSKFVGCPLFLFFSCSLCYGMFNCFLFFWYIHSSTWECGDLDPNIKESSNNWATRLSVIHYLLVKKKKCTPYYNIWNY